MLCCTPRRCIETVSFVASVGSRLPEAAKGTAKGVAETAVKGVAETAVKRMATAVKRMAAAAPREPDSAQEVLWHPAMARA